MPLVQVNLLAVLLAGVSDMVIGSLWYSMPFFGRAWMLALGKSEKEIAKMKQTGMAGTILLAFIAALVVAFVLAHVLAYADANTFAEGFQGAFWVWLGFFVAGTLPHYLFAGRSHQLFLIDCGYNLVKLLVMSAILIALP